MEAAENRRPGLTLTILAVACVAYVLQQTLVVPALPNFQTDLHTSETWAAWVFTGFLLTSAIVTTPIGKLGDAYGKRKLLVISLGIFAVGTIAAALSNTITFLILARALQGAAGAIFPLSFGIIRDEFPRERVGAALGLLSATFGVGAGLGLVLSGVILQSLSWHWLFWFGAIPVIIALVLVWRLIPESPVRTPSRFDVWGVLTLSIGLGALLLGLSEGEHWGWSSALTLGCFVGSLLVLALWCWVETKVSDPMMDMRIMRQRAVLWTNVLAVVVGFSMYGTYLLMPTLVQLGSGLPPQLRELVPYGFGGSVIMAGLYLMPATIMMLIIGPLGGVLEPRVGARWLTFVGLAAIGIAAFILTVAHSHPWQLIVAIGVLGVGVGLVYAMLAKLIVDAVAPEVTGVAMGMNTVMRTIGGTIGAQMSAAFLTTFTVGTTGLPAEKAFTLTFLLAGIVALVGLSAVFLVPKRAPVTHEPLRDVIPQTEPAGEGASV
jgi:EmrB/QacA subfamily drug resistance transporter